LIAHLWIRTRVFLGLLRVGSYTRQMSDVTRLLEAAQAGDRQAAADLLPLVYEELRTLAAARMANEVPHHTLDATALVHEAYLRLVGDQQFESRGHFFAAAAEAMRRILVDHARARAADKRGGRRNRKPLDDAARWAESPEHLIDLDDALARFASEEPRKAELVVMRFFGGMSTAEAAAALGVSVPTAERWWAFARTWLYAELDEEKIEN
jgi:RNA polymerase sigma factor (TIGR02999 family)